MGDKVKVVATKNFRDEHTHITYHAGQEAEVHPQTAQRFAEADAAVIVEEEALKEQKVEDLKQAAEQIGVDLEGSEKKEDIAKKIAGKK